MKNTKILAWGMFIGSAGFVNYIIGITAIAFNSWFFGTVLIVMSILAMLAAFGFNCIFIYKELVLKEEIIIKRKR